MTLKQYLIIISLLVSFLRTSAQNNIEFIENKGQWDDRIQYRGDISNGNFYIRKTGFTVLQHNPADLLKLGAFRHGLNPDGLPVKPEDRVILHSQAWHVDFLNASPEAESVPDKSVPTYNNYFIGNDPSKWASECKIYQAVTLKNIYPNVDVRYYTDKATLKYDIIVKPGADLSKIKLKYDGVDQLQVKNKQLVLSTSVGDLKEEMPSAFQVSEKGSRDVICKYVVRDNVVSFDIKGYNPTQTLVIDPIIVFGSFSGSSSDNWGFTATYGPDGSMFGGGTVWDDGGHFPTSPGAFQSSNGGGGGMKFDIGIIKLSSSGSNRIYATYIGGSGEDQPHSLIADAQGNLYIAGRTSSGNYPLANGGVIGSGGGYDIVVTKLNATGTALLGSRRIGGSGSDGVNIAAQIALSSLHRNYGDDGRSEIILDAAGNAYVASNTQSANFPVTPGAFQQTSGGVQDGVVLKFNSSLSTLLFASYLGGAGNDAAYVLSLAPDQTIYAAGGTESNNLPGDTTSTVGGFHGAIDGFISRIANNGSSVLKTTYVGTSGFDQIYGVQFDKNGFVYVMGQTTGTWPVINAAYSNVGGKQFICKLKPDFSGYVYSTRFGSGAATPNISPVAFLVDRCENVYISGWGGHFGQGPTDPSFQNAGTIGLPVTPDAFKSTTDGRDFYFFVLKKDAASQLFGSFYGENNSTNGGTDHVDGGTSRFDANGNIYQAICGNCKLNQPAINPIPDLVTNGAWSTTNTAPDCNLTMIKIAMNLAGVAGNVQSSINGVPRKITTCINNIVDFIDTIGNAQSYEWHFNWVAPGPQAPDIITTTPNTSHTYPAVGVYQVMLVAVDPNTCNVRDTSYVTITIGDRKSPPDFSFTKLAPCQNFIYQFDNLSPIFLSAPFTNTSFIWDFGDGSPRIPHDGTSITHSFPAAGTYNVKLILVDTNFCNAPDSITKPISVDALVKASFTTPATGCLPYNAVFKNTSTGGQSWLWEFGDNTSSTAFEPVHLYSLAGTYQVRLIANNPNTCNQTDTSAFFTITVFDSPTPDFVFAPISPVPNTPTTFTNLSSADAVSFKWAFGDGDSLITSSRIPVTHQYNKTGTFNACLTAINQIGCDSTICKQVQATIVALVDVPSAFTPNSNDVNSVIRVEGFGISKMQWTIWNRWGQKVFEATDKSQGWDGRFQGTLQPMDVYVYTLSVEFTDGNKATKKGDITMIR